MRISQIAAKGLSLAVLIGASGANVVYSNEDSSDEIRKLLAGNTLSITNRYTPSLMQFDDDGRLRLLGPDGQTAHGTWRVAGDSLCLTSSSGNTSGAPQEHCLVIERREFGSAWTVEDPRNGTVKYEVLMGHRDFK